MKKIVYLTSAELFNDRVKTARFDSRFKEATILKSYEDLEPGDYVVHEYQGIGQFVELINLKLITSIGIFKNYRTSLCSFLSIYENRQRRSAPLLSRKDWENTKKEKLNKE